MDEYLRELEGAPTDPEERRRRRRLLASIAVAGLSLVTLGSLTTGALFTDSEDLGANSFTTGTLVLGLTPTTALFAVANMAPGDTVSRPLTVSNTGTLGLRYAVTGAATDPDGKALRDQLQFTVYDGVTAANCTAGALGAGTVLYGAGGARRDRPGVRQPVAGQPGRRPDAGRRGERAAVLRGDTATGDRQRLPGRHDDGVLHVRRRADQEQPVAMARMRRLLGHRVVRRWVYVVALAVSLFGVVLSNAVPLWYRVHGERLLVVTGGSMAPKIAAGDAVVIRPLAATELRVGQVVTFQAPESDRYTTHRIVAIVQRSLVKHPGPDDHQQYFIRTQGDNNRTPDPDLTPIGSIRGIVTQTLPGWGHFLTWAHTPEGRLALYGPPLLLILWCELWSWRRPRPVREPAPLEREGSGATPVPV